MKILPNGKWTPELEDYAKRVEMVQRNYVLWRQKQARARDRVEGRSKLWRGLRAILAWLKRIVAAK